jgi:hypothetical protein
VVLALAVVALAGLARGSAAQPAPREYEIKAGFLFNFAKFVDWPSDVLVEGVGELRVIVIGHDPFDGALDRLVAGKTIHGHPVTVSYERDLAPGAYAHLVFVSVSEQKRLPALLAALGQAPTLTISDIEHFAEQGGAIGLVDHGSSIKFAINRGAAGNARLRVSSRLLALATIVK